MTLPTTASARGLAALSLAALLALGACSGGSTPAPATSAPTASASAAASPSAGAAGATAVTIQGFAFGPASVTIAVGTTVTWTNKDSAQHTVTADDGSFASPKVASGQTFSQTFSKAGTFSYHCTIHPTMTATITVH